MPQILVVAESPAESNEVVYLERISTDDFESAHFSGQLVERVAWAVGDADRFEREAANADDPEVGPQPRLSPAQLDGSPSRHGRSSQREQRRDGTEVGRRRGGEGRDARPRLVDASAEDQGEREVLEKVGGGGDRA